MQPTYICSEQHYSLMLGFEAFLSLKMLFDANYKLTSFDYKVDSSDSNSHLIWYIFTTVWGAENVQIDDMEVDHCQMDLYRIKIKDFDTLSTKTLQKIEAQAQIMIGKIEDSTMWDDQLFEAWYANKDGFEILMYPSNVDATFTEEILAFAGKIQEILTVKEDFYGNAA